MTAPARTVDVVFTRHPARRGFAWLLESWAMFSRARMRSASATSPDSITR